MQPPDFWYDPARARDAPALQAVLRPASWIYAAAGAWKISNARPQTVLPAICIGNVTLGGTGKTPIVRAVRAKLAARGLDTHVLSRGYGGRLKGPVRVDAKLHTAADVGDEPLLHARDGAAWIGADRAALAQLAHAAGAQAVVLDDGMQNTRLSYAATLLVIDAARGCGNGRIFPAGPLRESLAAGLRRAQAVLLNGAGPNDETLHPTLERALAGFTGPVIRTWIEPSGALPDKPLFAFAGIGSPDKFFATLEALGGRLVERRGYPDHYAYGERDMVNLAADAATAGARLITTEKDFVRIGARWRPQVSVLPVTAQFSDPAALDAVLSRALKA